MKTVRKIFVILSIALLANSAGVYAQGTFQNLDFEAANISDGTQPGADLDPNTAIPGWSASTTSILYDGGSLGGVTISIDDSGIPRLSFPPLQGQFSVVLFAGPDIGAAGASFISQTGTVPIGTESILMDVAFPYGTEAAGTFTLTLDAQQINMLPVESFVNYTLYGGDIIGLAGQTETLTITQFPPAPPTVPPSALAIDNIVFSPNPIPEPSTWALLLCGAGLLGMWRRWGKH